MPWARVNFIENFLRGTTQKRDTAPVAVTLYLKLCADDPHTAYLDSLAPPRIVCSKFAERR